VDRTISALSAIQNPADKADAISRALLSLEIMLIATENIYWMLTPAKK
jgi:hypothetical protein